MTNSTVDAHGRATGHPGLTAFLVDEVTGLDTGRIWSDRVVTRAKHAILDWLGVTIAGSREPSAQIVRQVLAAEGGAGTSRVWGTAERLDARSAALAASIAGHAMDFDDVAFGGHPSVVVLPAVFAVAEEIDASGAETLEAMVAGYEAVRFLSAVAGTTPYLRGFHTTGTFGAFGATVGVARLMKLDRSQSSCALGIAGTQASGLKASFGTMSKHLNAGNAAAVGVLSARLAASGFTGATDVVEASQGFLAAHGGEAAELSPAAVRAMVNDRLAVEELVFKSHAACAGTHSAIDGIRRLKQTHAFAPDDIESVELAVSEQLPDVCGIPEPSTGLEGKFSIRYAASLALAGGPTGPAGFTDEWVRRSDMVALRERVAVRRVSWIPAITSPTRVEIRLKDGGTLTESFDSTVVTPDGELTHQWQRLESKFRALVHPVLGAERASELVAAVTDFNNADSVSRLTSLAEA